MRPIAFLVTMILLGGCVCIGSQKVIFRGQTFGLVTGERLRAAFAGQKIRYSDPYDQVGLSRRYPSAMDFTPTGVT